MFKKPSRYSFRKGVPKKKLVFPLYVVRFQESDRPTFAVVAGKKVSKKAVLRNRTKRMFLKCLKEAIALTSNRYDFVFFLRCDYQEYSKSVIMDELSKLITKINA